MSRPKRAKLKEILVNRGLAPSLERAEALVLAGKVRVDGNPVTQAGVQVVEEAHIEVEAARQYVGRGAYKLLGALEEWGISPSGLVCADVGSSTGGFTQVLLERGAPKVFAIDVGKNELAWSLRSDTRVVVMESTNARYLERLDSPIQLATIDVSFISLKVILPAVAGWFEENSVEILALIKPQFEAPPEEVPQGGVIKDKGTHLKVLERFAKEAVPPGLHLVALAPSQMRGQDGNQEYVAHISSQLAPLAPPDQLIEAALARVFGRSVE